MSPTIFYERGFRFFFFSREETRRHIHVTCLEGEVKYWLEPEITLARNHKLSKRQLNQIEQLIKEHYNEIISAWDKHFPG